MNRQSLRVTALMVMICLLCTMLPLFTSAAERTALDSALYLVDSAVPEGADTAATFQEMRAWMDHNRGKDRTLYLTQ